VKRRRMPIVMCGQTVVQAKEYTISMIKPTIILGGMFPAFVGNVANGYSLHCSKCGNELISMVHDRQILGLDICCPCGETSSTQARDSGEPIASTTAMMPPGNYMISTSIDLVDKQATMVSEASLDAYRHEVGIGFQSISQPRSLDGEYLGEVASSVRALLDGADYERLLARGKRKGTPHRLVELVEYCDAMSERMLRDPDVEITLDGNLVSELMTLNSIFERWKDHPAWQEVRQALLNSDDVQHSLIQLLTASYLADSGNGVGIIFGKQKDGFRIPDLFVRPIGNERLEVEVKSPRLLRGPIDSIDEEAPRKMIEKKLKEAASSSRGQLDTSKSGVLAIGCFHLGPSVLENLR